MDTFGQHVPLMLAMALLAYIPPAISQNPGLQTIPSTASAPGSFNNGAPFLGGEPPDTNDSVPDVYGARDIDLPFYRLYQGTMNFFSAGELNTPTGNTDVFASENDNANQSACGIPDNAFFASKVAIHPYFLKYADLSRYCMQDVCISFWKEDGTSDMMLKVTDICSTDPNDPTHCQNPSDIKIDRSKAKVMEGLTGDPDNPGLTGNHFPEGIWWFFMKCWDDGLAQPAYQGNNWFTQPVLPNNLKWAQDTAFQQYQNNQISYAAKGWPTYPNGGYNPQRDSTTSPSIPDWIPGQEPGYSPIAGGVGWGSAHSMAAASSNGTSGGNSSAPIPNPEPAPVSSEPPPSSLPGSPCVSATGVQLCWTPATTTAPPLAPINTDPPLISGAYIFQPAPVWSGAATPTGADPSGTGNPSMPGDSNSSYVIPAPPAPPSQDTSSSQKLRRRRRRWEW